ncbi:MAG: hypothetical protein D6795_12395 [Deltaproteobacteria bacterium]|nr:MAG: hypothetical protein D6795_12395 [Deltaproteobacteria bacterium]
MRNSLSFQGKMHASRPREGLVTGERSLHSTDTKQMPGGMRREDPLAPCTTFPVVAPGKLGILERMRYDEFRAAGLCTSTGVVEAGCKTAIGTRCKRAGMHWSVAGTPWRPASVTHRVADLIGKFHAMALDRGFEQVDGDRERG